MGVLLLKRGLFIILLVGILSACGQQEQSNNTPSLKQEGIIVDIVKNQNKWNQILVVPNVNEKAISNKTKNELVKIAQEKEGAYYSLKPGKYEELAVGTHVIVYWNGLQLDSNPPQRKAEKIKIILNK